MPPAGATGQVADASGGRAGGPTRRWLLAVPSGAVVAGAVLALRLEGLLRGNLALTVALLLVLLVPTSRLLSRRILLAGAYSAGLVPALWWLPLPLGSVGRAGLLLAALAGGTTGWLLFGGAGGLRPRARSLLPRLAPVDALPLAAAAVTTWVTRAWIRVPDGATALAALLPGWDNSAHFDMVHMIRMRGLTVDRLGAAPGGEAWQFDQYPQAYHAVVATLMELFGSPSLATPGAELVAFTRAQAWLLVLLAAMLAAAVCSLPRLRRNPGLALVAAVLLVAAFVVGPGGAGIAEGFPNFVFACALTACVPLLVATVPRVPLPWHVAAIGGLLAGVAGAWVLMLVVAGPAAAVLLLPTRRSRWRATRRAWTATGVALAATVVGVLAPLHVLGGLDAGTVLVTPGGISAPETGLVVALALGAAALCLWPSRPGSALGRHAVAPIAGLTAAVVLAWWQLHNAGQLSYYFFKLLTGVELTSLAVAALALTGLGRATAGDGHRPARTRKVSAAVLAAVAASQVTGFTGTGSAHFAVPTGATTVGSALVAASEVPIEASRATLLAAVGVHPLNAQQWYLALTGRWTQRANTDAGALLDDAGLPRDLPTVVRTLLDQHDGAVILVDPVQLETAREAAGSAERRALVVGW